MIIIAGTIQMDPDKVADAMPAIVALMTATWAEDGCIDYVLSADPVRAGGRSASSRSGRATRPWRPT